ncbi:MAG: EexN family lipoprotein [Afipia sp.]|nr:EexN family lipoprotein [Afipia sp.]
MKALSGISLALSLLLVGCGEQSDETSNGSGSSPKELVGRHTAPTVVWLLENPEALEGTWKLCRSNPGNHGSKAACVNAGQAHERVLMLGRERALSSLKQ